MGDLIGSISAAKLAASLNRMGYDIIKRPVPKKKGAAKC